MSGDELRQPLDTAIDRPPVAAVLDDLSLGDLWRQREALDQELATLRSRRGYIDQELVRRFCEARTKLLERASGGAEMAEDDLIDELVRYHQALEISGERLIPGDRESAQPTRRQGLTIDRLSSGNARSDWRLDVLSSSDL